MHTTTVRLSDTTKAKLDDLCRLRQWSQSDWMRYWIEREWQRNRDLIEQARELAAQVQQNAD
jgi:predicted transcriptional regulator